MRNFSQAKMKTLRKEMMESLETIARRHGVTLEIGEFKSVNFCDGKEIKAEIRSAIPDEQGAPQTLEATRWKKECRRYGFVEEDFNKGIWLNDYKHVVRGIVHNRGLGEAHPTVKLRRVSDGKLRFVPVRAVIYELRKAA